ncbi:MAB_1171c family putative transporter [Nocardia brasiliensis]|uniref:MAB_1171c family putative transporter n=1 Tax=Nocardia brasiliensis TaxID=37326 RepID=UPI0024563FD1|nr:MAB_1171c family putative transporter [Nocardia brasiliensis]
MGSPVPESVAWWVIGYVAAVGAARLIFATETMSDRLINWLIGWTLAGLLLYRCTPTPDIASLPNQLALGCIVMTGMYLYGLSRLWETEADLAQTRWRQRVYNCVAVLSTAVIVLAGPVAADAGRLSDQTINWGGIVVWTAFALPQAAASVVLVRLSVRELRRGTLGTFVQVVCCSIVVACLPFWFEQQLPWLRWAFGWEMAYPHIARVEFLFTFDTALVVATLFVVPVLGRLPGLVGWDRDGRICRRLRPLWRAVTAAVPEIVMDPVLSAGGDSTARLLRMTVEIRDALLHLSPYLATTDPASPGRNTPDQQLRDYAARLQQAAHARRAGLAPPGSGPVPQPFPTAQDFDTELRHLLDLARAWPSPTPAPPRARRTVG